jgi:hypothetical protein
MAKKYLRNPDAVVREEGGDGGLLFNPDTNEIKVLNATGLAIWRLCDGTRDPQAIANALLNEFADVPGETLLAEVTDFLELLTWSQLIGMVEEPEHS